jgi:hypothetical protein
LIGGFIISEFNPKHDFGMVHIWGLKSYDDLTLSEPNLYTMNDIDIIYYEESEDYAIDIEAIYKFSSIDGDIEYLKNLLKLLTAWMKDNGYDIEKKLTLLDVFTESGAGSHFKTIPEAYTNFKLLVDGYCKMRGKEYE